MKLYVIVLFGICFAFGNVYAASSGNNGQSGKNHQESLFGKQNCESSSTSLVLWQKPVFSHTSEDEGEAKEGAAYGANEQEKAAAANQYKENFFKWIEWVNGKISYLYQASNGCKSNQNICIKNAGICEINADMYEDWFNRAGPVMVSHEALLKELQIQNNLLSDTADLQQKQINQIREDSGRLLQQQEQLAGQQKEQAVALSAQQQLVQALQNQVVTQQGQINAQQDQINIIYRVAKGFTFVFFCALGVAVANPGLPMQLCNYLKNVRREA